MPTADRTLTNVKKLPRSVHDSPSYRPDWRNEQVQLYLDEIRRRDLKQMPGLPEWEDDPHMRDLYEYRLGLLPPEWETAKVFRYIDELVELPDPRQLCALKALLIAGRSDEEIEDLMGITPLHAQWFERAFFNVRPLRRNIHHMVGAVLHPLSVSATSDREKLEMLYFTVAIHGSRDDLDTLILNKIVVSPEITARLEQFACNNLVVQGFVATVMDCARPPDSSDIDRWLKMRQRPGRRENRDGGQAEAADQGADWLAGAIEAFWGDRGSG